MAPYRATIYSVHLMGILSRLYSSKYPHPRMFDRTGEPYPCLR